jgi:hypothetical protein
VLVLSGTKDQSDAADRYRTLLPDCHFMLVYDGGRAIGAERPEALAFIALSVLDRYLALALLTNVIVSTDPRTSPRRRRGRRQMLEAAEADLALEADSCSKRVPGDLDVVMRVQVDDARHSASPPASGV